LLGGVHTESYALVHEVPASAYGYGGQTQEFRYISGKLKQMSAAA
jgi:4-oxalocrotonate tautomerase